GGSMAFNLTPNVHAERTPDGHIRQLRHLQQPYSIAGSRPRQLASQYLQDVAHIYEFPASALATANNPFRETENFTGEPVRLYLNTDTSFLDTTTVSYVETVGGLPIWEAGFSLTIQPHGVTSSYSTFHYKVKVDDPRRDFRP